MNIYTLLGKIKKMADNPISEIYPRFFSIVRSKDLYVDIENPDSPPTKPESKQAQFIIVSEGTVNACGITAAGLLVAMHGTEYQDKTKLNPDQVIQEIEKDSKELTAASDDVFFSYDIGFEGHVVPQKEKKDGRSIAHNFMVIQYKDLNNAIRFRIYQSYVDKYSLKEYIKKSGDDESIEFSQEEFQQFLNQMNDFMKADVWTEDIERFHKQYFKVGTEYVGYSICQDIEYDFSAEEEESCIKIVPGTITCSIEKRRGNVAKAIKQWDDFSSRESKTTPQIVCPNEANIEKDEILLQKLENAPISKDKTSIPILFHDPVSGNYVSKSVPKNYLPTIEAIGKQGKKDKAVYYADEYAPSLAGKSAVYATLFAETRATLSGKRKMFANARAFIKGEGSLFPNTQALLTGKRPFFGSVRRSFGMISDADIEKSELGISTKDLRS